MIRGIIALLLLIVNISIVHADVFKMNPYTGKMDNIGNDGISSESDTLDSVTDRGATTTNDITTGNHTLHTNEWVGLGSSSGQIKFFDTATDVISINNALIGIGTTTPGVTVDVVGDVRVDSGSVLRVGTSSVRLGASGDSYIDSTGVFGFSDATPEAEVEISIDSSGTRDPLMVSRADSGDGDIFIIKNSGRVGIGTTGPANILDVEGAVAIGATYSGTSAAPSNGLVVEGSIGIGMTGPNRKVYIAENTAGVSFGLKLDNFNTAGGAGNATGILFAVDGNGSGGIDTSRGKGGIVYQRTGATWNRGSFHILQNSSADSSVAALANSVVTIENDGDVGIGTSTPEARFEVQSVEGANADFLLDADDGDDAIDSWFIRSVAGDNNLNFANDTNNRVTFTSGGSVGIGNTSPTARLQVDDTGTSNAAQAVNIGTGAVVVTNAGNVGVATTAPGFGLEVNSTLQADDYYSGDGTQGITASCGGISITALTIKDGLITSCTGT